MHLSYIPAIQYFLQDYTFLQAATRQKQRKKLKQIFFQIFKPVSEAQIYTDKVSNAQNINS